MFKIGDVLIKGPVVAAPLAGVTQSPFRRVCLENGASLVYTEMICAKGIVHHNKNTYRLSHSQKVERPISYQIFGDEVVPMQMAVDFVEEAGADIVDINIGCPQAKIAKNGKGSGAALMKRVDVFEKVVGAVIERSSKPVTVKIRSGWSEVNAVEIAKLAEDLGVGAIGVHPRLGIQRYTGFADWSVIKDVKEAVEVPVIGSGDLYKAHNCVRMLEETGCDGIMIARGMRGNPWIFGQVNELLAGKEVTPSPNLSGRMDFLSDLAKGIYEHLRETSLTYGMPTEENEPRALREIRKFYHWTLKGFPKWVRDREGFYSLRTLEELDEYLEMLKEEHGDMEISGKV